MGPWNFGGGLPDGICAHPKIDPVTGELVVFRYGFAPPYLTWATVGPDGAVSQPEQAIDLDRPFMIHDFAVTEHYISFIRLPGGVRPDWCRCCGASVATGTRDAHCIGAEARISRWPSVD